MPYGITQCYLPPDRGENPAFTPSRSRFSDPGGMQSWVDLCYVKATGWEPATCKSQVQCQKGLHKDLNYKYSELIPCNRLIADKNSLTDGPNYYSLYQCKLHTYWLLWRFQSMFPLWKSIILQCLGNKWLFPPCDDRSALPWRSEILASMCS